MSDHLTLYQLFKLKGWASPRRTVEQATELAKAYAAEHGTRPNQRTSLEWRRWSAWLQTVVGYGLPGLCDKLGLPGTNRRVNRNRSMPEVRKALTSYFQAHGRHPKQLESREWRRWDDWLRGRETSLNKLIRQMVEDGGLPPEAQFFHTWEGTREAVQAHFERHGTRPTRGTSSGWVRNDRWLYRQGSSLRQLCDELGLPSKVRFDRTLEEAKALLRAHVDKHHSRPYPKRDAEWRRWGCWLRRNHGTSVLKLYKQMVADGELSQEALR